MKDKEELYKRKETRLLKGSLLRFDKDVKPQDLAEIMYFLFKGYQHDGSRKLTYSSTTNRKSGNFNTRSIEDGFRICKYYIPDITYKQVQEVFDLLRSKEILGGWYCFTSGRIVHLFRNLTTTKSQIEILLKELNIKIK